MKNTLKYLAFAVSVLFALTEAKATTYTQYNFNSSLSGPQSWSTTTNWTPNASPGTTVTSGTNNDYAYITAASGALNVTTPSSATLVGGVFLTASSGNALTLTLGNDLTLDTVATAQVGAPYTSGSYTNSGASSDLTVDLNGHTYNAIRLQGINNYGTSPTVSAPMTFKSTGSAGTYVTQNYAPSGAIDIQDATTIYARAGLVYGIATNTTTTTFSSNSTFQIAGTTSGPNGYNSALGAKTTISSANQAFGNLTFGDTQTGHYTSVIINDPTYATGLITVRGNMTLAGGNTDLVLSQTYTTAQGIKVGGNFLDQGGSFGYYTAVTAAEHDARIIMNGGAGTEHTLSINRVLVSTVGSGSVNRYSDFEIGDGTTAGNIKLVNYGANATTALNTQGSVKVWGNSRLNLDKATSSGSASLIAGSINIVTGASIADTLDTHSGFGSTSGGLTLNTFNLELNYSGTGWTSGSDLLLFSYGSLTGTPTLGTLTLGSGIASVGSLYLSGNNVYLSNVQLTAVPEPSAALLIGAFGGLVVWTVRRKNRKA